MIKCPSSHTAPRNPNCIWVNEGLANYYYITGDRSEV